MKQVLQMLCIQQTFGCFLVVLHTTYLSTLSVTICSACWLAVEQVLHMFSQTIHCGLYYTCVTSKVGSVYIQHVTLSLWLYTR